MTEPGRAPDQHLQARGRGVNVLFGFRHRASCALVEFAESFFLTDVALPPDEDGAVRCHVGGFDGVLLEVAEGLWLNAAAFAPRWPTCVSELQTRLGNDADTLLAQTATLEELRDDTLVTFIIEHQIRSEDLHTIGAGWVTGAGVQIGRVTDTNRLVIRFPKGEMVLEYTEAAYVQAHDARPDTFQAPIVPCALTFRGVPIDLDLHIPWRDAELAESLIAGRMFLDPAPDKVVSFCRVALEDKGLLDLDPSSGPKRRKLVAEILNLYGIALRREGRFEEATERYLKALTIIKGVDDEIEQHATYNLGYVQLQQTMKTTTELANIRGQTNLYLSHFEIEARHREAWTKSRDHFARALELVPTDEVAADLSRLTTTLLGLLDARALAPTEQIQAQPTDTRDQPPEWSENKATIVISLVIVVAAFVLFLLIQLMNQPRVYEAPPPPAKAAPRPPDLLEAKRAALFESRDEATLSPTISDEPCPIAIREPREVRRGEVLAPHFGRSFNGELYGTEYFDNTVRHYFRLFKSGTQAIPRDPKGVGPLLGTPSLKLRRRKAHQLTLVVESWRDPVFTVRSPGESGFRYTKGAVKATLLVWSYEDSRVVCAAEVEATNQDGLKLVTRSASINDIRPLDDPINRARLDLIEQALRIGIRQLMATVEATPDASSPPEEVQQKPVDAGRVF